eukprot:scaffold41800_cov258-Isochrysis_galbana.AAC.2
MRRCPDRYEVGLEPQDSPSADGKQHYTLHHNLTAGRGGRIGGQLHEESAARRHVPQTEDR